ncbi:coproporphyrinogen III oxidase [Pedobacter sp. Leaf170]|uniref:coproporphyrinogen III oxidase n=1 Tax=Pedobacter sp. Leaf170 TaxID=2876558 RepID=UPI001E4B19B9|nr:coproporphyrinogen III oxidase [Pedobacter sp. Leaf170]
MKNLILSLAFAGTLMVATTACNSSKNMAGSSDSTMADSTATTAPMDTTKTSTTPMDTAKTTTPPDTMKKTIPPI